MTEMDILRGITTSQTISASEARDDLLNQSVQIIDTLEQPDDCIPLLLPLLLDPSLSVRYHATTLLLHTIAPLSSERLASHLSTILTTYSKSFQHAQHLSSAPTFLRYLSLVLRVFTDLLNKIPATTITTDDVARVVPLLVSWIYPRPIARATAGGGGVMGNFGIASATRNASPVKKQHESKVSKVGSSSETEDEERRYTTTSIRLEALIVLRLLATGHAKKLYIHWDNFFADSPYVRSRRTLFHLVETDPSLSVRIQACATLETLLTGSVAYLAIADDRSTKASFTSLSNRIAETVIELHLKLASLLAAPSTLLASRLVLALLKLTRTIARNSPYHRIKRPLVQPLCDPILALLQLKDDSIVLSSLRTLFFLLRSSFTSPTSPVLDIPPIFASILLLLRLQSSADAIRIELWKLATILNSRLDAKQSSSLIEVLRTDSAAASIPLQEAQLTFISQLLSLGPLASSTLYLASPHIITIAKSATASESATLRVLACEILTNPSLSLPEREAPWKEAMAAVEDENSSVRATAFRALGLIVKSGELSVDVLAKIFDVCYKGYCSDIEAVKEASAWSLANCCDQITQSDHVSDLMEAPELIETAIELATLTNEEKIQTSGLRIIGNILRLSNAPSARLIPILITSSSFPSRYAKVRWNAIAALARVLAYAGIAGDTATITLIIDAMARSMRSEANLKVRIQAMGVLLILPLSATESERLVESVEQWRESLTKEVIPSQERVHFETLSSLIEDCCTKFRVAMSQ